MSADMMQYSAGDYSWSDSKRKLPSSTPVSKYPVEANQIARTSISFILNPHPEPTAQFTPPPHLRHAPASPVFSLDSLVNSIEQVKDVPNGQYRASRCFSPSTSPTSFDSMRISSEALMITASNRLPPLRPIRRSSDSDAIDNLRTDQIERPTLPSLSSLPILSVEAMACHDRSQPVFKPSPYSRSLSSSSSTRITTSRFSTRRSSEGPVDSLGQKRWSESSCVCQRSVDHRSLALSRGAVVRPKHTFKTILEHAIKGSPRKMLTLSQIYDVVQERFPYYKTKKAGNWKASIRHQLSACAMFAKIQRPGGDIGQGCYWAMSDNVPTPKSSSSAQSSATDGWSAGGAPVDVVTSGPERGKVLTQTVIYHPTRPVGAAQHPIFPHAV